jgi:hypothetical protein
VHAHLALFHGSDRQQQGSELLLTQVTEHVALVFLFVGPSGELVHAIVLEDLGVMSSRHCVKSQAAGAIKEHVELDVPIALDARIRRRAFDVGSHERFDHVSVELVGVVKDVMIDAERLGDSSRVVDVGDRATPRIRHPAPEFERGAHDLVTLLEYETRRNRRVHSSTHGDQDLHGSILPAGWYF